MTEGEWTGPIILDIPGDPAVLSIVRTIVREITGKLGFSERRTVGLIQAVDEACANIIRHSYGGKSRKRIRLKFTASMEELRVEIRDFGAAPDLSSLEPRDLREIKPGGLGLHLIRAGADEVRYEVPRQGRGCLLRLTLWKSPIGGQKWR